jgi:hypothetical protein
MQYDHSLTYHRRQLLVTDTPRHLCRRDGRKRYKEESMYRPSADRQAHPLSARMTHALPNDSLFSSNIERRRQRETATQKGRGKREIKKRRLNECVRTADRICACEKGRMSGYQPDNVPSYSKGCILAGPLYSIRTSPTMYLQIRKVAFCLVRCTVSMLATDTPLFPGSRSKRYPSGVHTVLLTKRKYRTPSAQEHNFGTRECPPTGFPRRSMQVGPIAVAKTLACLDQTRKPDREG